MITEATLSEWEMIGNDTISSAVAEIRRLQTRNRELLGAITNCGGDDLCWLDLVPRPVQIPPAPEFLESCRRYHAQISDAVGVIPNARTIAQLEADCAELQQLFDLQYTRMGEATKFWREATGRHDVMPDLGDLLAWLVDEIKRLRDATVYCPRPGGL